MSRIQNLIDNTQAGGTNDSWIRGETEELTLAVTDETGAPEDLTTALAVELRVKKSADDADPALLSLAIGTGITLRAQTGVNVGLCDIVVSSTQTFALPAGKYHYDVFVTRSNGYRKCAISPQSIVQVCAVINFPS